MNKQDTRQAILDITAELIQELGYKGLSYKHISERLGVKNAAIHYYFPAKADLGSAYVEQMIVQFEQYRDHLNSKYGDQPVRLLNGLTAIPRSFISKQGMSCPLGTLDAERNFLPESMLLASRQLSRLLCEWLTEILEKGQKQQLMHFSGVANNKALAILSMLQGASLMASANQAQIYEDVIEQLFLDLAIKS